MQLPQTIIGKTPPKIRNKNDKKKIVTAIVGDSMI